MERQRSRQDQNGLHAVVRVQMEMDSSRRKWETRCEPKFKQEKIKEKPSES